MFADETGELSELTVTASKAFHAKNQNRSIGSAQPGILPRHRDVLVVPAKVDVGAIAVAELQRLMLAHRD
jgi:hypothetical protein